MVDTFVVDVKIVSAGISRDDIPYVYGYDVAFGDTVLHKRYIPQSRHYHFGPSANVDG